jgi:hypothetical protein
MTRANLPTDLHPVTVGKSHIEDGDIGRGRRDAVQRFLCGSRLTHDFDAFVGLEELAKAAANDLVIIEEEHSNARHVG